MRGRRKDQIEVVRILVHVEEHAAIVALAPRYRLDVGRREMPSMNSWKDSL